MRAADCPLCGGELAAGSLKPLAPEWDEFDGCVGRAEEYRFDGTFLTCPHCGGGLRLTGTLWEDMNGLRPSLRWDSPGPREESI